MRNYDDAISNLRSIHTPAPIMIICLAATYGQAGDIPEAKELAKKFVDLAEQQFILNETQPPNSWVEFMAERWPFKSQGDMDHFLEGLRKSGLPD
jgi:hypothetical protein